MNHFYRAKKDKYGQVECGEDETTLSLIDGGVRVCIGKTDFNGKKTYGLHLTSLRLILSDSGEYYALDLKYVATYSFKQPTSFRSAAATLELDDIPENFVSAFPTDKGSSVIFKITDGGKKTAHSLEKGLKTAFKAKEWLKEDKMKEEKNTKQVSLLDMGISGIMRAKQEEEKKRSEMINEAFSDAGSLMALARNVNEMAANLRTSLACASEDEQREFSSLMSSMGLSSAVTKGIAGPSYVSQLAREICTFLLKVMDNPEKRQNIISIDECFGMYNRARGTSLVSPEDFMAAIDNFEGLKLGLEYKKYGNFSVIQRTDYNPQVVAKRIVAHIQQQEKTRGDLHHYTTIVEMSRMLEVSLGIAKLLLDEAEAMGAICRDESTRGVVYYINKFL